MSGDTHVEIARRLLEHARVIEGPDAIAEATDRICDTLRHHLVDVLGSHGYQFLLARAIVTSHASSALTVGAGDRLRERGGSALGPAHLSAVEATFASVFDLLSDIIGENLVLRLIHQAWPDFDLLPPFTRGNEANR